MQARFDRISVAGLLLGVLAVLVGQFIEGASLAGLVQPTAFVIVIGGTLGATMLQSSLPAFREGLRMAAWVFRPPSLPRDEYIRRIVAWASVARKEGLLVLESELGGMRDPFVRKGLQLLIDGADPERVRDVMEVEVASLDAQMRQAGRVWEAAGGYAPTLGILGAVLGLIHVMENLADPGRLGHGIATAFVATIYGVGSANLIFLPMARKLTTQIQRHLIQREMVIDGLVGIANGDNPRIIDSRLNGYRF